MVLQFIKPPFPIVEAQQSDTGWKIAYANAREFSGPGKPPRQISWFQLPAAMEGRELSDGWVFQKMDGQSWRLENRRTGEFIEGFLGL